MELEHNKTEHRKAERVEAWRSWRISLVNPFAAAARRFFQGPSASS